MNENLTKRVEEICRLLREGLKEANCGNDASDDGEKMQFRKQND